MPCKPRLLLDYALRAGTLAYGLLGLVGTMKSTYYLRLAERPVRRGGKDFLVQLFFS